MCRHDVADWDAARANPALQGQGRRQSRRPAVVYGTLPASGAPSSSGRRGLTSFRNESRRSLPFQFSSAAIPRSICSCARHAAVPIDRTPDARQMQHASQGQSRLVVPMKHPGVSATQLLKQPLVLPAGRTAALLCVVVAIPGLVYVAESFDRGSQSVVGTPSLDVLQRLTAVTR
jgi:hypothetical protein